MKRVGVLTMVLCCVATAAFAQNSVYGVRGLGFPGRPWSVRARALGGGWGMFDNFSTVNPAATAGFTVLSVNAVYGWTVRSYSIDTTSVSGLRETRFPNAVLGGNLGRSPFSFAVRRSQHRSL